MKSESLFNWKKFFLDDQKDHESTPSLLCFPTFFSCSISSILSHLDKSYHDVKLGGVENKYNKLCYYSSIRHQIQYYFKSLQTILQLIITNKNYKIRVKHHNVIINNLMHMIKTHIPKEECLYLEWYLEEDDESIKNYNLALKDVTLEYNKVKSTQELLDYLKRENLISQNVKDNDDFFSSRYYIFPQNIPISKNVWGPIYWNVFHSLPNNALFNVHSIPNETILLILHFFNVES